MFFDNILKEVESLGVKDISALIQRAMATKVRSESLWRDGFLDRLVPIKSSIQQHNELNVAKNFYSLSIEPISFCDLLLHCIANMPDVFNGTMENLFDRPQSWEDGLIDNCFLTEESSCYLSSRNY